MTADAALFLMRTSTILACASVLYVGVCGLLNLQKTEQNSRRHMEKKIEREKRQTERT